MQSQWGGGWVRGNGCGGAVYVEGFLGGRVAVGRVSRPGSGADRGSHAMQ